MTEARPRRAWSTPIAAQVVALLMAVVAIGQVLTLAIALLVPPPPPSVYRLSDIATALNGQTVRASDGRALERLVQAEAPSLGHAHADQNESGRAELAQFLGVPETRVLFEETPPGPPIWDLPFISHRDPPFEPHRPRAFDGAGGPAPEGAPPGGPRPDGPDPGGAARQGTGPGDSPPGRAWRDGGWLDPFGDSHRYVWWDFTATLQQPSGDWAVVRPAPAPFPTTWQKRVGLWFLACLLVLAPVGYVFARRLVAPIGAFALAADRLGRDPNAPPLALSGPAEIGIAAHAFNTMQTRLQRYIKDRTSMISAISHDLRTPLARVRFKMEAASDELRASVGSDLDQMEAMITAVLAFMRNATQTRERTELDLLSVLETAVDDAVAAGGRADLRAGDPVVVEADDLALKRLFANVIENAIKYGGCADVRLKVEDGAAVVEVADAGPGLPSRELERVFEPFYRAEPSRNRETGGMGLGLAVARSIARAHGGDVTLKSAASGLTAIVRLPLAPRRTKSAEPAVGTGPG
ncbi:MAG: HAMP domain-containing sensor histidine kinase [Caulobacteraceae bacterium]|nr:HAMP domain-containing sensor histidine kinase [Caulobacteraceae bacterium]